MKVQLPSSYSKLQQQHFHGVNSIYYGPGVPIHTWQLGPMGPVYGQPSKAKGVCVQIGNGPSKSGYLLFQVRGQANPWCHDLHHGDCTLLVSQS